MENSDLKKRSQTAAVLCVAVLLLLCWAAFATAGKIIFVCVIFVLVCLCAYEFGKLCFDKEAKVEKAGLSVLAALPAVIVTAALFASPELFRSGLSAEKMLSLAGFAVLPVFPLFLVAGFVAGRSSLNEVSRIQSAAFPGLYLAGGGAVLCCLPLLNSSVLYGLWLVLVVCINDIAAYFTGRALGGPKLCPEISPKKTWSGSAGGLAAGTIIGVLAGLWFGFNLRIMSLVILSAGTVISAQVGDLAKSQIKRTAGVKDSGSLLPGHGGFLDRLDGLLGSAAVFLSILLVL